MYAIYIYIYIHTHLQLHTYTIEILKYTHGICEDIDSFTHLCVGYQQWCAQQVKQTNVHAFMHL